VSAIKPGNRFSKEDLTESTGTPDLVVTSDKILDLVRWALHTYDWFACIHQMLLQSCTVILHQFLTASHFKLLTSCEWEIRRQISKVFLPVYY